MRDLGKHTFIFTNLVGVYDTSIHSAIPIAYEKRQKREDNLRSFGNVRTCK
jgi:hypothetical protein